MIKKPICICIWVEKVFPFQVHVWTIRPEKKRKSNKYVEIWRKELRKSMWMYLSINDVFSSGEVPQKVWDRVLLQPCVFSPYSFKVVPVCIVPKLPACRDSLLQKKANLTQVNSVHPPVPLLLSVDNSGADLCNLIIHFVSWTGWWSVEIHYDSDVLMYHSEQQLLKKKRRVLDRLKHWWDWRAAGGSSSPSPLVLLGLLAYRLVWNSHLAVVLISFHS